MSPWHQGSKNRAWVKNSPVLYLQSNGGYIDHSFPDVSSPNVSSSFEDVQSQKISWDQSSPGQNDGSYDSSAGMQRRDFFEERSIHPRTIRPLMFRHRRKGKSWSFIPGEKSPGISETVRRFPDRPPIIRSLMFGPRNDIWKLPDHSSPRTKRRAQLVVLGSHDVWPPSQCAIENDGDIWASFGIFGSGNETPRKCFRKSRRSVPDSKCHRMPVECDSIDKKCTWFEVDPNLARRFVPRPEFFNWCLNVIPPPFYHTFAWGRNVVTS